MNKTVLVSALTLTLAVSLPGCGLFGKKKLEDTDTYRELMEHQKEIDKKLDSVRKENYKQMIDSAAGHTKKLDSLKHITDSLKQKLDKNIQELKNKK